MSGVQPKLVKRRVRTGCLQCREKHKKCDEQKPVCGLCQKKKIGCTWPAVKIKNQSVNIKTSPIDSTTIKQYSDRLLETLESPKPDPISISALINTDGPKLPASTNFPKLDVLGSEDEKKPEPLSHVKITEMLESSGSEGLSIQRSRSLMDEPPVTNSMSDSESSFSPDSLMAPFLHYTNLHRTFRDYMFTNVATATDVANQNDLTDVSFRNILQSPAPEFLNHKNSSKNLQELLDDQDFFQSVDFGTQNQPVKKYVIEKPEQLQLIKAYIYEVAPWLDMFDSSKQFGTTVVDHAKSSKTLMASIYAIASRQKEQLDRGYPAQKTVQLYQETLSQLIPTVNKTLDCSTITACVILCVFEMMSSSPRKWRYHLEGCAALFKSHNITGFGNELERGLFWCYARMDVSSAVIGEESTIIPSESWLPDGCSVYESKELFTKFGNVEDMYANYMVFLCSRVLNLIARPREEYEHEWKFLWAETSDWHINRPFQLQPIASYNDMPFPGVLYLNGPAISANQLYHMAIILLTQNKPHLYKIRYSDHIRSPIWHAKQICAISLHNEHHGCWNNALQPLWIAGQLLSGEQEHKIVLDLLTKIESTTGWQMNFRAKDLQRHWEGEIEV